MVKNGPHNPGNYWETFVTIRKPRFPPTTLTPSHPSPQPTLPGSEHDAYTINTTNAPRAAVPKHPILMNLWSGILALVVNPVVNQAYG